MQAATDPTNVAAPLSAATELKVCVLYCLSCAIWIWQLKKIFNFLKHLLQMSYNDYW